MFRRHMLVVIAFLPLALTVRADETAGFQAPNETSFAVKMKEHGYSAQIVEAKDRTHHTLACNIGTQGDPATEKIIEFIANEERVKK